MALSAWVRSSTYYNQRDLFPVISMHKGLPSTERNNLGAQCSPEQREWRNAGETSRKKLDFTRYSLTFPLRAVAILGINHKLQALIELRAFQKNQIPSPSSFHCSVFLYHLIFSGSYCETERQKMTGSPYLIPVQ